MVKEDSGSGGAADVTDKTLVALAEALVVETQRIHKGMKAGGRGAGGWVARWQAELDLKVLITGEAEENQSYLNCTRGNRKA